MSETKQLPPAARLTVSVDEAAQLLGISRNLAYAMAQSGELPNIRAGYRRLVPKAALEAMLAKAT